MAVEINYLAVLVAALASIVLGSLWYSPVLFGKEWMKLSKITEKDVAAAKKKGGMWKYYLGAFVASLVTAYILAHFVDYAGATTIIGGLQLGFWVWLGFIVTTLLSSVLWEGKPVKLYLISIGYYLVLFLLMGALLAAW